MTTSVFISPALDAVGVSGACCTGTTFDHFHIYVDGEHVHSVSAK